MEPFYKLNQRFQLVLLDLGEMNARSPFLSARDELAHKAFEQFIEIHDDH